MSRRRRGLTRARVATAALAVADTDGVSAVSMRRVAQECGVEAMSLYSHVANKQDLLLAMIECRHGPAVAAQLCRALGAQSDRPTSGAVELILPLVVAIDEERLADELIDWAIRRGRVPT